MRWGEVVARAGGCRLLVVVMVGLLLIWGWPSGSDPSKRLGGEPVASIASLGVPDTDPQVALDWVLSGSHGWFERAVTVTVASGNDGQEEVVSTHAFRVRGVWTPTVAWVELSDGRAGPGGTREWSGAAAERQQAAVLSSLRTELTLGMSATVSPMATGAVSVEATARESLDGIVVGDRWAVATGTPPENWPTGPAGEVTDR